MLDVIFILLIFNILLIGGAHVHELQVALPNVHIEKQAMANQQDQDLLQLYEDGSYSINQIKLNNQAELKAIINQRKLHTVALACDKQVKVTNLLEVLNILREAGVSTTDVLLKYE